MMAYLNPGLDRDAVSQVGEKIRNIKDVRQARFISKHQALDILREDLKRRDSLLDNLDENPLPDAFEIVAGANGSRDAPGLKELEALAVKIESFPEIEEVEYGQQWLDRFTAVFQLFRLIGFSMGGVFVLAAVLIVANTIRLVIYTRREELRIMRLVGACDGFIKMPFYIQGIIQGLAGSLSGIAVLYAGHAYLNSTVEEGFLVIDIRFLSLNACAIIVAAGMLLGWFGCFISLKQFLKL